ncbi:Hypp6211 [Branchiostoma lanceolatum]|uniref:Hypp6211 protein n=1 Tax=Branchiostoma lanceolatum TaxID=7740 RepID=A0A8J9W603_BRALA|nr:Hypp6211 [Branchiostoma lanceolatum]
MKRDNSICVTTTQKDKLSAQEAFALLDSVGVPTSSLQPVQALNQTSFDVTFRTLSERTLYAGKLAQLDSIDVRV